MRVQIRRLDPSIAIPAYSTSGAAAFDLAAAEEVTVPPHEIRLIGTGLIVKVPDGHFLAILARSSTPLKRGLIVANGMGVIDSDYCGPQDEVKVQLLNVTDISVTVRKGDRIAQAMVLAAPRVEFEEIAATHGPSRGGFGSTGQ